MVTCEFVGEYAALKLGMVIDKEYDALEELALSSHCGELCKKIIDASVDLVKACDDDGITGDFKSQLNPIVQYQMAVIYYG